MTRRAPAARAALAVTLVLCGCAGNQITGPTLAGNWTPLSAQIGGQEFPVASFQGGVLELTSETYEFAGDKGTYKVYAGGAPARMDITGTSGPNAGRTIPSIYSFDGELLTIAYQLAPGAERPAELISPPGSQVLLVRYKRAP
ncbi:MAG: TIGR03067 domain-containing protein [Gemmatimonadales bacterium]